MASGGPTMTTCSNCKQLCQVGQQHVCGRSYSQALQTNSNQGAGSNVRNLVHHYNSQGDGHNVDPKNHPNPSTKPSTQNPLFQPANNDHPLQQRGSTTTDKHQDDTMIFSPPETTSQNYVLVEFHCLLSTHQWGFDDFSNVYMCFAAKELGEFKFCYGPMLPIKSFPDGYLEFCHTMKVPMDVVLHKTPVNRAYKYFVISPATKNGAILSWEFIAGPKTRKGKVIDRSLKLHVPTNKINCGAKYPHYDGIIWPELQSTHESSDDTAGALTKVYRWVFGSKSKESTTTSAASIFEQDFVNIKDLKTDDHKVYRINELRMYLEVLNEKLNAQETRNNPVQFVRMIWAIYDSLNNRNLFYDEVENEWRFDEVAQEMYQCLRIVTQSLVTMITAWPDYSVFIRILILLMIYHKCKMLYDFCKDVANRALLSSMLQNLAVDKSSYEEAREKIFSTHHKSIEAILQILFSTASQRRIPIKEWIFAVPLIHFLTNQCHPFEELQSINREFDHKPQRYQWGNHGILASMKLPQECLFDPYLKSLQTLFDIDPLLPRLIVNKADVSNLLQLIGRAPVSVIIMKLIEECALSVKPKVKEVLAVLLVHLMSKISGPSQMTQWKEDLATVQCSMQFFQVVLDKVNEYDEELIVLIIQLILYSITDKFLQSDITEKVSQKLTQQFRRLSGRILEHSIPYQNKQQLEKEIRFWNRMIQPACVESVLPLWQNIVKTAFAERLAKSKEKLPVLVAMDATQIHPLIYDCTIDQFLNSEEQLSQQNVTIMHLLKEIEKMIKVPAYKNKALIVLNRVLLRRYPQVEDSKTITMEEIIDWNLWPNVFTMLVTGYHVNQVEDVINLSKCAYYAFISVTECFKNIIAEQVTVNELIKYNKHLKEIEAICTACNSGSQSFLCVSYTAVSSAMNASFRKYIYVKDYAQKLNIVVDHCSSLSSEIEDVSKELKSSLRTKRINEICRATPDGQLKCICFSINVEPEMFEYFSIFGKEHRNDFFDSMWLENCQIFYASVPDKKKISFCGIYEQVWKPTIVNCRSLLHGLCQRSITVSDIKPLSKQKDIDKHLTSLCVAMHHCYPETKSLFPEPNKWVSDVSKDINQFLGAFNQLEKLNSALSYCLTLKERLKLKGDFSGLKDLDEKVMTSLNQATLGAGTKLLQFGVTVKDVFSNHLLCTFFDDVYFKNIALIDWIKEVTNDYNQFVSFIRISEALVQTKDRTLLSKLHDVGTSLRCLIYDLPETTGFYIFLLRCQALIDILMKDKKLAKAMEACSNKLEWFRGLRKQLGTFDNSKKEALLYFPPETEQNDFVTVDFYCLLSIEQWHLDKSSKVYLRFAAKELGTFDSCHGPMLLKGKRNGGEYLEFHYSIKIPMCVLNKNSEVRKYKYHVESPATDKDLVESLEFISGPQTHGGVIDRSLKLRVDKISVYGQYKKCDGIILPEHIVSPTGSDGYMGKFKGFNNSSADTCNGVRLSSFNYSTKELSSENHVELRKNALLMHLEGMHDILIGVQVKEDAVDCIESVCATFLSLHKNYLCYKATHYSNLTDHLWTFTDTEMEMKAWLASVVQTLVDQIKQSPEKSFLQNSLCVLVIYFKLKMLTDFCANSNNVVHMSDILRNMGVDQLKYEATVKVLWNKYRDVLVESVSFLITCAIKHKPPITEWIFAIPVLFFLKRKCTPPEPLKNIGWDDKIMYQWGDDWLSVDTKMLNQYSHQRLVDHSHLQELQPWFKVDPIILRLFVRKTQIADIPVLISKVSLSILIMRLAEESFDDAESHTVMINALLKVIPDKEWLPLQSEEDITSVIISLHYLNVVQKSPKSKLYTNLFKLAVQLCLFTTTRVLCNEKISDQIIKEVTAKVTINLKALIINGTTKICNIRFFNVQHPNQGPLEAKYWTDMFNFECEECVKQLWHGICYEIIDSRLTAKIKPAETVKILMEHNTHEIVKHCLLSHMIEGLQHVEQKDVEQTVFLTELHKLVKQKKLADKIMSLLNKYLCNIYPHFAASKVISVQDLLSRRLWPNFIGIFVTGCDVLGRKQDIMGTSEIVDAAMNALKNFPENLNKGIVTEKELLYYNKCISGLKSLCEAFNYSKLYPAISSAIDICFTKLKITKEYRYKLCIVVEYCKPISDKLTQDLCKQISDYSDAKLHTMPICDLCTGDDPASYKCICFTTNDLPNEMIENFLGLGVCLNAHNQLFEIFWKQNAVTVDNAEICFTNVYDDIWTPTIHNCTSLVCTLHSKSINLSEIVRFSKMENFSHQLSALSNALIHGYPASMGGVPPSNEWVPQLMAHIALYRDISSNTKCIDAANVLLKMQNSLHLLGDFRLVERLTKIMEPEFKEQKLADVDENMIHTWIHIRETYTQPALCKCLDVFTANKGLVDWLKEATNSVGQLVSFVEVCSSTAGEVEFNMTRLSYLHSVGTGFGALIYELPEDAGFEILDKKCNTVWGYVESNANLSANLEECSNHLEWFKELKSTQGSIEVAAIARVNDVNEWGEYIICSSEEKSLLDIGDAIKLRILRSNAVKTEYSLDDLRDLESKLVLITGKDTAGRNETDRFLNYLHLGCRIANALLTLRNAGHAKYIVWSYTFYCKYDVYDALENQAKKMETELQNWTSEIANLRNHFHALNYFTTQQLRVIRQSLGQLDCKTITCLPTEVMSMLMSISFKICQQDIVDALIANKSDNSGISVEECNNSNITSKKDSFIPSDEDKIAQIIPENEVNIESAIEKKLSVLIDQLSEVHREVYDELEGFDKNVAYLGIKWYCSTENSQALKDDIVEKVSEWCVLNETKYKDMDRNDLLKEIELTGSENDQMLESSQFANDVVQSDSNMDTAEQSNAQDSSIMHTSMTQNTDFASVRLIEKELIEYDIPSGLAREAAELGFTDIEEALGYCLDIQNSSSSSQLVQSVVTCSPSTLRGDGERKNPYVEQYDRMKVNEYLDLERLANILEKLATTLQGQLAIARQFANFFQPGEPNLVLVPSGKMLKASLSIYYDLSLPFPSMEEVVICTPKTSTEEIVLLWRRAVKDPGHKQIFCLIHGEKLSYKVCDESIAELSVLSQGNNEYRIVIICSSESEETSHVVSKLLPYKRDYTILHKDKELSEYLKYLLRVPLRTTVDPEHLSLRLVTSEKSGMGKSLYVRKLVEKLRSGESYHIVPIHGPKVDVDTMVQSLQPFTPPSFQSSSYQIIHIDIDSEVLSIIDTILFSLVVLRAIKDNNGNVWRVLPTQLYMLEVTSQENLTKATSDQDESIFQLLKLLPTTICASPKLSLEIKSDIDTTFSEDGFKLPAFQCVSQYLKRFMSNEDLSQFKFNPKKPVVEGDFKSCISTISKHCSVDYPSWATLAQFVRFLHLQLIDCQDSIFCDEMFFGEGSDFKKFVVRFMIRMSKDFGVPSLKVAANNDNPNSDKVAQHQIAEDRKWDKSNHPYIFFNQDQITMTFIGFKVNDKLQCTDPKTGKEIEGCAIPKNVYECLLTQGLNLKTDDCNKWDKKEMIDRLCRVIGINDANDPDPSYVLTTDNLLKMMAIHMRFRCDIPVVIMGETGCGKTRLIRYMCELQNCNSNNKNLVMLKVHGGTSQQDIIDCVKKTEELAKVNYEHNKRLYTILFFDEANTTENIGLIKEIMCDRRLNGKLISDNVKFIAACNPYRKHTDAMIKKLETAGLGYYVKAQSTQHKFGSIPLRHLVYRVLDLPLSMQPLLYDFGQVSGKTEDDYITQIVTNHVSSSEYLSEYGDVEGLIRTIATILAQSQSFMRSKKDECSFVSLRDVERAMIVFQWFYENNDTFEKLLNNKGVSCETRSMIMTLAVCYHARIQEREKFEDHICPYFDQPMEQVDKQKFQQEISSFQDMILSEMKPVIPKNIARNAALKENVFMMLVCIELKIPLFVIGKPGSSKSLAKSIIENSMQGASSNVNLCHKLKQVKLFSYQCSQHSTPESILEVFSNAKKFQESKDIKQFVSVVVLDEVGLAEDSPSLPLKALHPLLEDGTSGADTSVQHIAREERVAFIGISNWALDPAKMNRGVMITRGSPDENELEQSAWGICSTEDKDLVRSVLQPYFVSLAKAYMKICKKQTREFFGLRDFYSLIKMLYWMVKKTKKVNKAGEPIYSPLTRQQLKHAIKRNFDGLHEFDATEIFLSETNFPDSVDGVNTLSGEEKKLLHPNCDPLGLIKASLNTKDISWHGESRYLLFMTQNFAALRVLQQHLLKGEGQPPFVLFGSSFPKDMEYTQVCRNINQIKICMETGRTAILLNLENLYESLYDVLNQYYTKLRENRYVDLGLQSHRIKCRVDDNFKMILIAEKETVYSDFPTPLINRLEKHFVVTSTILTQTQTKLMKELTQWAIKFTSITEIKEIQLKLGDAFVGYQDDTTAAVVFQAYHNFKECQPDDENADEPPKEEVLDEAKSLLLNIASPDAIIRLKYSKLANEFHVVFEKYFNQQCHSSLSELLSSKLSVISANGLHNPAQNKGLLLQVTTHSHLLSEPDVSQLCKTLDLERKQVTCYLLQEFDTEMDFCNKVKQVIEQEVNDKSILIIQCDSGHLHSNLIACARHKVIDEIVVAQSPSNEKQENEIKNQTEKFKTMESKASADPSSRIIHVVFIVQLPRKSGGTNFVGFQGGDWVSVHLDDLRAQKENEISFQNAIEFSISEIFNSTYRQVLYEPSEENAEVSWVDSASLSEPSQVGAEQSLANPELLQQNPEPSQHITWSTVSSHPGLSHIKFNANRRLRDLIQMACSLLYESEHNRKRTTQRINILTDLIPTEPTKGVFSFDYKLVQFVTDVLKEVDENLPEAKEWAFKEALKHSQISGTFRNALSRRLDEMLLPILAKIIGLIDKNFNLTIIHENRDPKKMDLPIAKIWLAIFSDRELCKINYEEIFANKDVQKPKKWVPGIGANLSDHSYNCQFPFSWICRDVINSVKQEAAVLAERSSTNTLQKQTMALLQQTPLQTILAKCIPEDDEICGELCCLYLNDYIAAVYHPTMDDEHKLVYAAVYAHFSSMTDSAVFLEKLVNLHLAYEVVEPQLQQFKQLVSLSPGIVQSLSTKYIKDSDFKNEIFDLALCAVKVLLASYQHNNAWKVDEIKEWIWNVTYYQNSIMSILSLKSISDATDTKNNWKRILVLKAFAVIIAQHEKYKSTNLITFSKQIKIFLKKPDFKTAKPIQNIAKVLQNLQESMKTEWNIKGTDPKDIANKKEFYEYFKFIQCCEKFFIEIVSSLCFEQAYDSKDPSPELIEYLMQCVYTSRGSTQSLTPFLDKESDAVPVIRSYLLQLLISIKAETMDSLKHYFDKSRQLAEKNDKDLYVLCTQCFEDEHYKCAVDYETADADENYLVLLKAGFDDYLQSHSLFTVENLKAIATLRYCLSQLADFLHFSCQHGLKNALPKYWKEVIDYIPTKFSLHKSKHPAEYFVKYIVRKHGVETFNALRTSYPWIVPDHLKSKEEKGDHIINPAQVYHEIEEFNKLSEAVTIFIASADTSQLDKALKVLTKPNDSVLIVMAFYANVVLKMPSTDISVFNNLKSCVDSSSIINADLKNVTKQILEGKCNDVVEKRIKAANAPHFKQIVGILVHCVSVLLQQKDVPILKPCVQLLLNPSLMKQKITGSSDVKHPYFPTMPIPSENLATSDDLLGSYYTCGNQHTFLVIADDCEKFDEDVKCECGSVAHKSGSSKFKPKVIDTGHILGKADARSKEPEHVRSLMHKNCTMIRVLLHAILTWNSCFSENRNQHGDLSSFVNPSVQAVALPQFFWKNLEKDLCLLATSLSCSFDDAVLVVHLLFKRIAETPAGDFPGWSTAKSPNDIEWSTDENRQSWEEKINKYLIEPLIDKIDQRLKTLYSAIIKDTDTFYLSMYESKTESDDQGAIHAALWRYRTRVSLEHLLHSLKSKDHKILSYFLHQESVLRAMQYLPGILKLQKYLFDHFHQEVGQERQLHETIGSYKKSLKQEKEMFAEMVNAFNKAWLLLKSQLQNNGRLRVPPEYVNATPEITDDTILAYLLPTTTGEGICSTSLVDFLVKQHNEFMMYCYNNLPETYDNPQMCKKLLQHAIPLSQLQTCHVISYEYKLIPVILTHCQYSLHYGKGTDVEYDHQAIERDLFDKFIFGKPLILIDRMPRVVLRKDAHDATFYQSILAKVPQEDLPLEKKKSLLVEIKKLNHQKLSEFLDVIEIVLGFLASAGGAPDKTFHQYVTKTLAMQRSLPKPTRDCVLANAISLWGLVSVVQSCQLTELKKAPFDRLDKAYRAPLEKTNLQQALQKIASPIDFLIALHNFIVVHVSHASPDEYKPKWRLTEVWIEVMEASHVQQKVDLKSISIPDDVLMCHVADVWEKAVELLWKNKNLM